MPRVRGQSLRASEPEPEENDMPQDHKPHITDQPRELPEITVASDTRDYLARATRQARAWDDYELIVDVDAHLQEGGFWGEIIEHLENDVLKYTAETMHKGGVGTPLINMQPGMSFQALAGRVPHQSGPKEKTEDPAKAGHRFVQIVRRTMDAMGVDYQVIFPTAMLHLGMNPMEDIELHLARAYARWLTQEILPQDKRIIGLFYLPFNSPTECEKLIEQYADTPGIVGFTICAVRHKPVHANQYMRLYSMIEETGKPLAFHAGPHWDDPSFTQLNRFISMHALSFVHYNLIHMTNWIINAMPERFPKMKTMWVESGLAWIPFLMQRLDHEVLMRQSEAPGLKRRPSEYMREMYLLEPADGAHRHEAARQHVRGDQGGHAAAVRVGLAALGLRSAGSITTLPFLDDRPSATFSGSMPRGCSTCRSSGCGRGPTR